jgi:hypothetical protein
VAVPVTSFAISKTSDSRVGNMYEIHSTNLPDVYDRSSTISN